MTLTSSGVTNLVPEYRKQMSNSLVEESSSILYVVSELGKEMAGSSVAKIQVQA